jgi:type VI protein secretion system component Hcp
VHTDERRKTVSEDTNNVEKTKPEAVATELSEQELNEVAGGAPTHQEFSITKLQDSASPKV